MVASDGFHWNWLTNSSIVHAVADDPEGPYTLIDTILPNRGEDFWDGRMTHNPSVYRTSDGGFALFYTGSTYTGETPTIGTLSREDPRRMQARANQRIGLLTAPSIHGPWRRRDTPILSPRTDHWDAMMVTNPAAVIHPDGSVLLYYKSVTDDHAKMGYGVARAPSIDRPFERLPEVKEGPLFSGDTIQANSAGKLPDYEDAYVWFEDDTYRMIFKDMNGYFIQEPGAGVYATSPDGIAWTIHGQAYSKTVTWADGSVITKAVSSGRSCSTLMAGPAISSPPPPMALVASSRPARPGTWCSPWDETAQPRQRSSLVN